MMENREYRFTREDIVTLLCEAASQYARRNGPPLDVLIYGGAAVTLRHEFRTAAHDIDYALREPSPLFEDCVEDVGKGTGCLPFGCTGWSDSRLPRAYVKIFTVMPMCSI